MTEISRADLEAGLDREQIEALESEHIEAAARVAEEGTRVPGMSYEEGVRDTLSWLLGETDESPMQEA